MLPFTYYYEQWCYYVNVVFIVYASILVWWIHVIYCIIKHYCEKQTHLIQQQTKLNQIWESINGWQSFELKLKLQETATTSHIAWICVKGR